MTWHYLWDLVHSWLRGADHLEMYSWNWCYNTVLTDNGENEGQTLNVGWIQYSVCGVLSVCWTRCMLYSVYAVLGECCTRCILYSVFAVLGVCCTRYMLSLGYAVLAVCCTRGTLPLVYASCSVCSAQCALCMVFAVIFVCCTWCMLYLVYAILGVCCTWCMLYLVYAVLGICCTWCVLYLVYTILGVHCTWCILYLLCTVFGVCCTLHMPNSIYAVHGVIWWSWHVHISRDHLILYSAIIAQLWTKKRYEEWRWNWYGGHEGIWETRGPTCVIGFRIPHISLLTCWIWSHTWHIRDGQLTSTQNSLCLSFS